MNRKISAIFCFLSAFLLFHVSSVAGQSEKGTPAPAVWAGDLKEFVETPAVSGSESELLKKLTSTLAAFHPAVDNLGDVVVTIGSGSPRRLIVAPIDESGFVVSGITDDGYLRVQRLPQNGLPPIFNELYSAQPVKVRTTSGKWIDGVFAGLSVHLQPGRANAPKSSDIENMYVDIGATSAAEVRKAGVDILSPIVLARRAMQLDHGHLAGVSIGDRFGAAALVEILRAIEPPKVSGTLTVAFVVQQRTGARGLERILSTLSADEMIYVGRLLPGGPVAGVENIHRAPRREPGSGVLLGLEKTDGAPTGLGADLKQLAEASKIPFATDYSGGIIPLSYLAAPPMPAKWAHIGIATAWPDTPAETVDLRDIANLRSLLARYVGLSTSMNGVTSGRGAEAVSETKPIPHPPPVTVVLAEFVRAYGISNHEGPVRDQAKRLLPAWAKPELDDAGNLILRVGTAPAGSKTPRILVVAHMDEIGFEVKSISKDGRLEVEWRGGMDLSFFEGHPALVHTANGDLDAIVELPNRLGRAKFQMAPRRTKSDSRGCGRAYARRTRKTRHQGRRHDHDSRRPIARCSARAPTGAASTIASATPR